MEMFLNADTDNSIQSLAPPYHTHKPFVEEGHVIHSYFLPRWYAIALPVALGVCLLAAIGSFVGVILMRDSAKRKAKKTS